MPPNPNSADPLRQHYSQLTNKELQAIAADSADLTENAASALDEELRRRGLPPLARLGYDEVDLQKWVVVGLCSARIQWMV